MNSSSLMNEHELAEAAVTGQSKPDYGWRDLVQALRLAGICSGDVVLFHISHGSLGEAESASSVAVQTHFLKSALHEAVGQLGTILLPAFSFSFQNHQPFDLQHSPAVAGEWSSSLDFLEYFRSLPGVVRSADPIYSLVGLGPRAQELLQNLPHTSFGKDCVYERLHRAGGKVCTIGGALAASPYVHYVEESIDAPHRYKKLFTGAMVRNGDSRRLGWIANIPVSSALPMDGRLEPVVRSATQCRIAPVGRGEVVAMDCQSLYEAVSTSVNSRPYSTAELLTQQKTLARAAVPPIHLRENASFEELITALWRLPRDIVSDGYDAALYALSGQVPIAVHEYPTGTECWTWLVPEKWTCHQARLETTDGRCLLSYEDNPLHVVSYSLPMDREVSREELLAHLHTHPQLPDAVPFIFKYYERDWGLCCSRQFKESLGEDAYRVVIDSEFSFGALKVGEVIAPGRHARTFVLCAHLCHPAMVNDDLAGVLVGIKVMHELRKRQDLRYTYRLLILPETIGSVAYLSHNEALVPDMIGGLFLEMLGLDNPHALQLSFAGDTTVDHCLVEALEKHDPTGWTGAFRTVVGNDERQFNAPGVRVPMLSLSRVQRQKPAHCSYYPQYHSSQDSPEITSVNRLAESVDLVLKMIDTLESTQVPVNCYSGEVFCSRYGLHIDAYANPEGNRALFDIMFLIDGVRSLSEIARTCNVSLASVRDVVDQMVRLGLVRYADS
jgi:aminopeptidase-like protein/aminoglycoside N3'-acetyltransferase